MATTGHTIKPFSFESLGEFGAAAAKKKAEEEIPPPPTFSEEELQKKGEESYALGFKDGLAQGRKEAEDKNRAAHEQLSKSIDAALPAILAMETQFLQSTASLKEKIPQLVLAMSQKVAGKALAENPTARIQEVLEQSIALISAKPEVWIIVHPSVAEALKEQLTAMWSARNITTKLNIHTDEALTPANLRVEWKDGGVATNVEQMWREIEKVLEETL